jgi:hypothetical protein
MDMRSVNETIEQVFNQASEQLADLSNEAVESAGNAFSLDKLSAKAGIGKAFLLVGVGQIGSAMQWSPNRTQRLWEEIGEVLRKHATVALAQHLELSSSN